MNKLNTSLPELLNMLKIAESHIKKDKAALLVDRINKKKSGKKGFKKLNPKSGISKNKKGKKASKQSTCFFVAKRDIGKGIARLFLQV